MTTQRPNAARKSTATIHLRLASVFTGEAAKDETMRSRPRCRPGFAGPVWTPEDPRLTDDPAAVTCGQCRRLSS